MKKISLFITILIIYGLNIVYTQSWTQLGSDIDGEAMNDYSGSSVSLSSDGKRIAIGAPGNTGTYGTAGHVRVYSESGGVWTQLGSDIDGEAAGDKSGQSISLSSDGKRVAIGAWQNDGGTASDAGHVRIYSETEGVWTQLGSDIDGESIWDYSGWSVSLSSDGKRIAIGAYGNVYYNEIGHVRIYSETGGVWTQLGSDIDGEAAGDWSGYSVSLSSDGKRVAIGAYYNDGTAIAAGHVRVYSESAGVWSQVGSDIDGEAESDVSGESVSLSSDGKRVAIGATGNDGTGDQAGHVRVYSEIGGVWTQLGSDIDGEAAEDYSGRSVSLSSDGKRVAIGAPGSDGTGSDAGHVRVYATDVLSITDNEIFYSLPNKLTLLPAYPNPFNPITTILYGLEYDSQVKVEIFDISGKLITTLQDKNQTQGWHSVIWKGTNQKNENMPTGVYLSKITSDNEVKTNKLMLLK